MTNGLRLAAVLATSAFLVSGFAYADGADFRAVDTPQGAKEAQGIFDAYLKKIDRNLGVVACSALIYNHPGSVETIFAGVCQLNTGIDVTVCGDTGVGEFALSWNADNSTVLIARFANANCPGG